MTMEELAAAVAAEGMTVEEYMAAQQAAAADPAAALPNHNPVPPNYQVGPAQGGIRFGDHELPLYQLKLQPVDAPAELKRAHNKLHKFVDDTLLKLPQKWETMQSCPDCEGGRANNAYALKADILNLIKYNAELVKRGVTGHASQSVDWNTFPNIISVVGSTSAELNFHNELQDLVRARGARGYPFGKMGEYFEQRDRRY